MSVIDAFLSTWSNTRSTYGAGTPQTGAQYDKSSALRGLQTTLELAAPGSRWTGGAATRYDGRKSPPKIVRILLTVVAFLGLVVGCTSNSEPDLPPSTDTSAIAERVTGPDGQAFLREITSAAWEDDGRHAGEPFAWIPRDATSDDRDAATRAGHTAQAIASFLADNGDTLTNTPANPALWQAFSKSLVPYLGAMVGDDRDVPGFAPLDGLNSGMPRSAALFGTVIEKSDHDPTFTDAASKRAHGYDTSFAKAAMANPLLADRGEALETLLRAARLRARVAAGAHLADPESPRRNLPFSAQTDVMYQVASLTAQPDDPHIEPKFFRDGRLLSPSEFDDDNWSIYDAQLTVYLTPWPRIREAIDQFGGTYASIAIGQ
ncbi:EspA/EspE family type VII secretion system effector [Mycolicibacterium sp. XJ662]